jgi:hypothetical protein
MISEPDRCRRDRNAKPPRLRGMGPIRWFAEAEPSTERGSLVRSQIRRPIGVFAYSREIGLRPH